MSLPRPGTLRQGWWPPYGSLMTEPPRPLLRTTRVRDRRSEYRTPTRWHPLPHVYVAAPVGIARAVSAVGVNVGVGDSAIPDRVVVVLRRLLTVIPCLVVLPRVVINCLYIIILGAYSLSPFRLTFPVKFSGFITRKVIHISTGQGEYFLRMTEMPGHDNSPSF